MSTRKGRSGLLETTAFIDDFPLDPSYDKSKVITVADFDEWAVKHGFIADPVERDTRNSDRNILRAKINNTASSKAWLTTDKEPFHIAVKDHGHTYSIEHSSNAFAFKAAKLPREMESLMKTKKGSLDHLLGSLDVDKLPSSLQLRIKMLNRQIVSYAETVELACSQLNREFHAIQADIVQSIGSTPPMITDGGIDQVLRIDEKKSD